MTYKDYLKSLHWNKIKIRYAKKFPRKCDLCESPFGLELHHTTYDRIGNEELIDLVYLCRKCHQSLHDHPDQLTDANMIIKKKYYEIKKPAKKPKVITKPKEMEKVWYCSKCMSFHREPIQRKKGKKCCPKCLVEVKETLVEKGTVSFKKKKKHDENKRPVKKKRKKIEKK